MATPIRSVVVELVRVSPLAAELLARVELAPPAAGTELRGRLVGPKCEGVSTVEVAYPLRAVPGSSDTAPVLQGVIPEPNLWSPTAPFRYEGRVEAWRGGMQVDARAFTVELRPR